MCVWVLCNKWVWEGSCMCVLTARTRSWSVISSFFFLSAMQHREEERSILTSLFPGRLILFFQIRALTGFWYSILMSFRSGLSSFFVVILLAVVMFSHLESEGMDTHWCSTCGRRNYKTSLDWHHGLWRSTREDLNMTSLRSLSTARLFFFFFKSW